MILWPLSSLSNRIDRLVYVKCSFSVRMKSDVIAFPFLDYQPIHRFGSSLFHRLGRQNLRLESDWEFGDWIYLLWCQHDILWFSRWNATQTRSRVQTVLLVLTSKLYLLNFGVSEKTKRTDWKMTWPRKLKILVLTSGSAAIILSQLHSFS